MNRKWNALLTKTPWKSCSPGQTIGFHFVCLVTSVVSDFVTPWTVAHQAPQTVGFLLCPNILQMAGYLLYLKDGRKTKKEHWFLYLKHKHQITTQSNRFSSCLRASLMYLYSLNKKHISMCFLFFSLCEHLKLPSFCVCVCVCVCV